jgi:hypothetical protein
MLPIRSNEPEKFFLIFERSRYIPKKARYRNENHIIGFSISENLSVEVSSSFLKKCGILYFAERKITDAC